VVLQVVQIGAVVIHICHAAASCVDVLLCVSQT
jgi:hypothetical protein